MGIETKVPGWCTMGAQAILLKAGEANEEIIRSCVKKSNQSDG